MIVRSFLLKKQRKQEQKILIKELEQAITTSDELMKIYKNIKEKIKPYLKRR